ncbi:MAG: cell division protein ZapE [Beijerinckiaceae bacterium]
MPNLLSRYQSMVESGHLAPDAAQEAAARQLSALVERIGEKRMSRKSSALGWLFGKSSAPAAPLKGLYIWGDVGRGKTMLMDMFFGYIPAQRKKRVHFHDFMADVHDRVHVWRQQSKAGTVKGNDPIQPVAESIAEEAWVLCFDEFAVSDIADAMILGRLFTALWDKGVVVVATSNVVPDNLYSGGLNRSLFLPFIAELKTHMDVLRLDARTDYRLEMLGGSSVFLVPADKKADAVLDDIWRKLTGSAKPVPRDLVVRTRKVTVPAAAPGVARFKFEDLCDKPLGALDYIMLAREFHTVILDHIPVMEYNRRNQAKRFITLIDVLYEHHVKLIASAEAEASALYMAAEGREAFEFDRTISRLMEMRSDAYLAAPHGRVGKLDTSGIVET